MPHTCSYIEPENKLEELIMKNHQSHEHGFWLYWLTKYLNLKSVVELGVLNGATTIPLLLAVKEINGTLTSFDIVDCVEARQKVDELNLSSNWKFNIQNDIDGEWLAADCLHSQIKNLYYQDHRRRVANSDLSLLSNASVRRQYYPIIIGLNCRR